MFDVETTMNAFNTQGIQDLLVTTRSLDHVMTNRIGTSEWVEIFEKELEVRAGEKGLTDRKTLLKIREMKRVILGIPKTMEREPVLYYRSGFGMSTPSKGPTTYSNHT